MLGLTEALLRKRRMENEVTIEAERMVVFDSLY